jgi:hypothetical protein
VLRMQRILLATVAMLAASAIAASAALAQEAPFYRWKPTEVRLGAAEEKEVTLAAEGNQVLENKTAKITITCENVKATLKESFLVGSAAGEPGTSKGKLEYSNCTVTGNGTGCTVTNGDINTNALKDELAYEKKQEPLKKGNPIVDYFTPANGKPGAFATVNFTGASCTNKTTTVEGSVNVEIFNKNKELVAVEEHEKAEEWGLIKVFTGEACKVKESKLSAEACVKPGLKAFGTNATLEGEAKVELASKEVFGVFSK